MERGSKFRYGGISGVEMAVKCFDLGEGIMLRQTYAHLMSPQMMAFAPPGPQGFHPAPWKAAAGGFSFDINIEIRAPDVTRLGDNFDVKETIWWLAALLRLARFPYLSVSVLSDYPFDLIPSLAVEPTLEPFETERRIFQASESIDCTLDVGILAWIKDTWLPAGQLMNLYPKFYTAFKAFDSATIHGRTSSSLLALWGGLEQLFAPSRGELRFRVASLLASYLEAPGAARFDLYKEILKLYDKRSIAAHTAQEIDTGPLVQTYVLMRNALMQMVNQNRVPAQDDLETLLFCSVPAADPDPPRPNWRD